MRGNQDNNLIVDGVYVAVLRLAVEVDIFADERECNEIGPEEELACMILTELIRAARMLLKYCTESIGSWLE